MSSLGVGTELKSYQTDATEHRLDKLTNCSTEEPLNRDLAILYYEMTSTLVNTSTSSSGKHIKNFQTRPAH